MLIAEIEKKLIPKLLKTGPFQRSEVTLVLSCIFFQKLKNPPAMWEVPGNVLSERTLGAEETVHNTLKCV